MAKDQGEADSMGQGSLMEVLKGWLPPLGAHQGVPGLREPAGWRLYSIDASAPGRYVVRFECTPAPPPDLGCLEHARWDDLPDSAEGEDVTVEGAWAAARLAALAA